MRNSLTPVARTPEAGGVHVASEGRASRSVARALGLLVERIAAEPAEAEARPSGASEPARSASSALRDALRQAVSRSRDGALLCRMLNGTLILEGVPIERKATLDDPGLSALSRALLMHDVGSVTIREGASPGELLTLGRLLAHPPSVRVTSEGNDTPATVDAVGGAAPRELLRTWSVLVTPVAPAPTTEASGVAVGGLLARLASARTDAAVTAIVGALMEALDDAVRRGDGVVAQGIARGCMAQLHAVGESGGRLALEGVVRQLHTAPLLDLLARQLPYTLDRTVMLQLFARAGDAGVAALVRQLLSTDDGLARRAYFDSIVTMDIGAAELFDALGDSRWFVVRNAAALLGEMAVARSDDSLIPLLRHDDERIRIAVARALMRLRTAKALQALHGAIDDGHAEIRRLAAAAFGVAGATGGGGMRPQASRLTAALERERDEDVKLEMLAALGRLGSADAVQRLLRIALPSSPDPSAGAAAPPRDSWMRVAALQALVRARGHQIASVVDTLTHDADPDVAAAAVDLRPSVSRT